MYSVAVMGNSGHGKSRSLKTLDPKKTFIIDSDSKGLPWSGWQKQYNKESKNYLRSSEITDIEKTINIINKNEEFKHIDTLVIDTMNAIMLDQEMKRMKEKGYDKWMDLAQDIYSIISLCNKVRNNLIIICIFHIDDVTDDNGFHHFRFKTNGRKLEKIQLESKFNIVLLAKKEGDKYIFETQANFSTAKSPEGMFKELTIPNDMKFVVESIQKYDEIPY